MITLVHKGNFKATETFLRKCRESKFLDKLDAVAKKGVDALTAATPVDTGKTAESWRYRIYKTKDGARIYWYNTNVTKDNEYLPVVILIQYGHATKNGAFVEGRDFINPAMAPIFDEIAEAAWTEVTK